MMRTAFISCFCLLLGCLLGPASLHAVWDIETVDSSGDVGWYASMKLDSSNNPHIAYYQNTDRDLKYAVKSGGVWGTEIVDGTSTACGKFSSLAFNTSGYPVISYANYGSVIRCAAYNGSSWSLMTPGGSDVVGFGSAVAVGGDNHIHISYANSSYNELYYATYDGGSWTHSTLLVTSAMESCMLTDGSNNPWCAFVTNSDNVYIRRWNGAAWIDASPPATAAIDGYWPSMRFDTSGNPHVSFCSLSASEEGDLQYYRYNGTSWTLETPDTDPNTRLGMFSSLALDASNDAHISYHDHLNWKLKYATNTSGSWQIQTLDPANSQYFNTSIDLDSSGNPHIAYYDQVNKDLKYAVWVPGSYTISGTILDGVGNSISGVYVFLAGNDITTNCLTDENGFYSFSSLPANGGNTYTVTPLLSGYVFSPSSRSYSNLAASQTAQNFIIAPGSGYSIGGYALNENNQVISETVTVQISGDTADIITADPATGYYLFENLTAGGSFTITPSVVGREFSPQSRTYSNLNEYLLGENFTLVEVADTTEPTYSISGYVYDLSNSPLTNVLVRLNDGSTTTEYTTDANGYYGFGNIVNGDYTISLVKSEWQFEPASRSYADLSADYSEQNYLGQHNNSTLQSAELKIVPSLLRPGTNSGGNANGSTITFRITQPGKVVIKVFSIDGVMVNLLKDDHFEAGTHRVQWVGKNDQGSTVASGIYFVDVKTPTFRKMKKICVVK